MKNILITIALLLTTTFTFAQFQVKVTLDGECVQPDQNTYYVVKIEVRDTYNGNVLVEDQTLVTPTTNYTTNPVTLTIQLDQFCTQDALQRYRVYAEAAKAYLNPPSIVCEGKCTKLELVSCDQLSASSPGYIFVCAIDLE